MSNFNGKRSRPIPNKEVFVFLNKNIKSKDIYQKNLLKKYLKLYFSWIQKSKLNKIIGIKKFNKLSYTYGTSQAFDEFYSKYKLLRFRCFKGEFKYHEIIWKENKYKWEYIEDDKIKKNDAVIISVPFSDFGSEHPKTKDVISQCEKLNVPVLIDFAYYSISRNINFNVNKKCIKVLTFSLSKSFYGAERIRIGIRLKKKKDYDSPDLFNEMGMVSKIAIGAGIRLLKKFKTDYCQNKYRKKQIKICKLLNLIPSDCVIFGIAKKDDKKYYSYNRGSVWRRVCISELLGDMKDINE